MVFSPLVFPLSLSQPGTENAVTRSAVLKILKQRSKNFESASELAVSSKEGSEKFLP